MIKLVKKTVKKAGLASLLAVSMFALGTVVSPQVESYKTLRDELSSMSAGERQKTVYKEMAEFKASTVYQRLGKLGERMALDPYYPRRANFSRY